MDFFQRQDAARSSTFILLLLMFMGVACVVALIVGIGMLVVPEVMFLHLNTATLPREINWPAVIGLTVTVLIFIACAMLYKTIALGMSKGHGIALSMGGRLVDQTTSDAQERMLLNVVEEMAIASGMPVPAVYIMDDEQSINAFAAGFSHDDAVIGVTKGSITALTRDELQGIIGHEFSHILNGDMRLNLRLIGVLFGLLALSQIGRSLLRAGNGPRRSRAGKGNGGQLLVIGFGVYVVGLVGYGFGSLIQAAVSRQREFLADASSVQFTRNPQGLAGAFKKIGGLGDATLAASRAGEVRHMLFSSGLKHWFGGLMATHPPLGDRIKALTGESVSRAIAETPAKRPSSGLASGLSPAATMNKIGQVTPANLSRAQAWLGDLDPTVKSAAHDPLDASALVLAVLLSTDPAVAKAQAQIVKERSPMLTGTAASVFASVATLKETERLSIVDLAMPALQALSDEQRQFLIDTAQLLIKADDKIELFEYTLLKILKNRLLRGKVKHLVKHQAKANTVAAATVVLSAVASASHADPSQCGLAYKAGASKLPGNALASTTPVKWTYHELDEALTCLDHLLPLRKKALLDACAHAAAHDGVVSAKEAQIFRAVGEAVGCPTSL